MSLFKFNRLLIPALLASFLSAGGLLAHDRMPEFSWEKVPAYIHIRKDTAFTEKEVQYLASFPLITIEKYTGNKTWGSTEMGTAETAKEIKKINPRTKILYYRNVIVHYGGYEANALVAGIPGGFLLDETGGDKLVRGKIKTYDLSNPDLRAWWVGNAKEVCSDPNIDGIFLDGVVKVLEGGYLQKEIGDEKKAEVVTGYDDLIQETRRALGPKKLMVSNVLRANFPDSGLEEMRAVDGSYIEAFEYPIGWVARPDYIAKGMEAFQTAARSGAIIAFTAGLGKAGEIDESNFDQTDEYRKPLVMDEATEKRFTYLLAMFLVCAEKYSYFNPHDGYDAKTSKMWMKHPDAFEKPLGKPKAPAVRDGYVFTREFAHASVKVDVKNEVGEIVWN